MTDIVFYSRSLAGGRLTHSSRAHFNSLRLKWGRLGGCILICSGKYFNISFSIKTSYWSTFTVHIRIARVPTFWWRRVQTHLHCHSGDQVPLPQNKIIFALTSPSDIPCMYISGGEQVHQAVSLVMCPYLN